MSSWRVQLSKEEYMGHTIEIWGMPTTHEKFSHIEHFGDDSMSVFVSIDSEDVSKNVMSMWDSARWIANRKKWIVKAKKLINRRKKY